MQKNRSRRLLIILGSGCLLVLFLALRLARQRSAPATSDAVAVSSNTSGNPSSAVEDARRQVFRRTSTSPNAPAPTAEEIVARKVIQFGRNRRELVHALAKRFNVIVPDDVERFFQAVEGG